MRDPHVVSIDDVRASLISHIAVFRTESAFHMVLNFVWVDPTKSDSVRPKCSTHVILFPQISFINPKISRIVFCKNTYDFPGGKNTIRTDQIFQESFLKDF